MLTGDKMETATCIAKSSRLVSHTQEIHQFKPVATRTETHNELNAFRRKNDCALVVQGETMETILKFYESEFMELTVLCPAVIICRCSPTQKAEVVRLLRSYAKKRTCAIGDGGNDVSMIQAADVGIGIVGKEGKQASLAADFSIDTFSFLGRLLMWHGRNSYRRSANLSQFIMHRGLLVSTMQAIFSSIFYFSAVPLFQSFLMVGYATIYTQLPVFSLVLDKDVTPKIAMDFPELYKELTKGRTLTFKTFFIWVIVSVFQGSIIMYGALLLFENDLIHIVSITFTALLITEYLMIALTIETWHYLMVVAEFLSLAVYIASIAILDTYFDGKFLMSTQFMWKTLAITLLSCVPLVLLKLIRRRLAPPVFTKLQP